MSDKSAVEKPASVSASDWEIYLGLKGCIEGPAPTSYTEELDLRDVIIHEISVIPDVANRAGVGDGSVRDAVIALTGTLANANMEIEKPRAELATVNEATMVDKINAAGQEKQGIPEQAISSLPLAAPSPAAPLTREQIEEWRSWYYGHALHIYHSSRSSRTTFDQLCDLALRALKEYDIPPNLTIQGTLTVLSGDPLSGPAVSEPQSPPQANRPGSQSACAGTGAETGPAAGDSDPQSPPTQEAKECASAPVGTRINEGSTPAAAGDLDALVERLRELFEKIGSTHRNPFIWDAISAIVALRKEHTVIERNRLSPTYEFQLQRAEAAERERDECRKWTHGQAENLGLLRGQLEAAERDAARYQWLRQFQWLISDDVMDHYPTWGPGTKYPTWQEATDFAIDEAMKK